MGMLNFVITLFVLFSTVYGASILCFRVISLQKLIFNPMTNVKPPTLLKKKKRKALPFKNKGLKKVTTTTLNMDTIVEEKGEENNSDDENKHKVLII